MISFARHDFHDEHGGNASICNGMGLMSYGDRPDAWTDCNNRDFEGWYRSTGFVCLEKDDAPYLSCGPDLPQVKSFVFVQLNFQKVLLPFVQGDKLQ